MSYVPITADVLCLLLRKFAGNFNDTARVGSIAKISSSISFCCHCATYCKATSCDRAKTIMRSWKSEHWDVQNFPACKNLSSDFAFFTNCYFINQRLIWAKSANANFVWIQAIKLKDFIILISHCQDVGVAVQVKGSQDLLEELNA